MFRNDVNCEIPQVVGAIDGTLIEILAPEEGDKISYYARTKRYAVSTNYYSTAPPPPAAVVRNHCHCSGLLPFLGQFSPKSLPYKLPYLH